MHHDVGDIITYTLMTKKSKSCYGRTSISIIWAIETGPITVKSQLSELRLSE